MAAPSLRAVSVLYFAQAILPIGTLAVMSMFFEAREIPGLLSFTLLPLYVAGLGIATIALAVVCFLNLAKTPATRLALMCCSLILAALGALVVGWVWALFCLLPSWFVWKSYREIAVPHRVA